MIFRQRVIGESEAPDLRSTGLILPLLLSRDCGVLLRSQPSHAEKVGERSVQGFGGRGIVKRSRFNKEPATVISGSRISDAAVYGSHGNAWLAVAP